MTQGLTETQIQSSILEFLGWKKILAWRCQAIPVPIRRGNQIVALRAANKETVGIPDILAVVNGQLLGIEVKGAKGKLRPEQEEWKMKLEQSGARWMLARSVQDVQYFLRETFHV